MIQGKNTNPSFVLNDVWVKKTLIHPWVLLMVVLICYFGRVSFEFWFDFDVF